MIRIVTDSTCDLSREALDALGVDCMLPLKVHFDDREYLDKVELSPEMFYQKLEESQDIPTTSLVNAAEFEEAFNRYPDDEIIVLPIASDLSGTCQSACIARENTGRDNIHIVDTKAASMSLAIVVETACKWRDEGVDAEEICKRLKEMAPRLRLYAIVDTLKYLVRGGRLSKVTGAIAKVLNLKPIISFIDGKITSCGKARGMTAAIDTLRKIVDDHNVIDSDYPAYFAHSLNAEGMKRLIGRFSELKDYKITTVGSVIGTHAGPGAVGIAFLAKA